MDINFNFELKFNGEKNGQNLNVLAFIVLVWYPVWALVSLIDFLSGIGLMSLIGLALACVQVLGAYNAAFFRENGHTLLQLTNLVNLAWTALGFIVGIIRGGFSFGGLLSCIINLAIILVIMWYLNEKKALFDVK
ncbi:MAG: hypothetical protein KBS81_03035 [Spirochaetales bacterium]|nr:hypothetical protein [Candidatus Physcosoma equi]